MKVRGKSLKNSVCFVIVVDLTSLLLVIPYAWNMEVGSVEGGEVRG